MLIKIAWRNIAIVTNDRQNETQQSQRRIKKKYTIVMTNPTALPMVLHVKFVCGHGVTILEMQHVVIVRPAPDNEGCGRPQILAGCFKTFALVAVPCVNHVGDHRRAEPAASFVAEEREPPGPRFFVVRRP